MIILRTNIPIVGRNDVWASEINVGELSPARRDKLVSLVSLAGFVLRTDESDIKDGEIRSVNEVLMIENGV